MININTERLLFNLRIALTAIQHNKFRAILTALGIIFGVAAVITMLAIGNGAKEELIRESKLIGVNNIVVEAVNQIELEESGDKDENNKYSPGLTVKDLKAFSEVLDNIDLISPEVVMNSHVIYRGKRYKSKLVGVENSFFEINNLKLAKGNEYSHIHMLNGEQVCIIGSVLARKIFMGEEPIGKYVKSGKNWLKVIGVVDQVNISSEVISKYGVRNYNEDIYIPFQTMLIRYKNNGLITENDLKDMSDEDDEVTEENVKKVAHQIDKITLRITETSQMVASVNFISRMMERRHYGVEDYEIIVPFDKIKQQQKTKDLFKKVLVAIAGISLLVGGIGIMNIMMASVIERTKEIGLRQAVGATEEDVILQFVTESTVLSIFGGLIGIALGIILSFIIEWFAGMETSISFDSIFISFTVSAGVGVLFGYWPASQAAKKDPISSLRYE